MTSTTRHYFHKDHLGSSTAMTDASGAKVETTEYVPYGEMREHTGTEVTNYKFTDQELDPETGLYNYGARLYDPVIGRFISPDPIIPNVYDPQMLNRYSYCRNNPLIYTDPTGHYIDNEGPGNHMGADSDVGGGSDPDGGDPDGDSSDNAAGVGVGMGGSVDNRDNTSDFHTRHPEIQADLVGLFISVEQELNVNRPPKTPDFRNPRPTDDGWYSRYGAYDNTNIDIDPEVAQATAEFVVELGFLVLGEMMGWPHIGVINPEGMTETIPCRDKEL